MNQPNDVRYSLKSPWGSQKNFRIVVYKDTDFGREYFPFKDERLDAINQQFRDGLLTKSQTVMALKQIISEKYRTSDDLKMKLRNTSLCEQNDALLERFWRETYGSNFLSDPKTARYEYERALRCLGSVSLLTAKSEEIHEALKKTCTISQHRRVVGKLNHLLRFNGRALKLKKPPKPKKVIKYLKKDEILLLAQSAPDQWMRDCVLGLFGTGCRIGEFLAIGEDDLRDQSVWIDKQITIKDRADEAGTIKSPKRNKEGMVEVIPFCWESVERWALSEKSEADYKKIFDFITTTSQTLWAKNKLKHITPHDLRHSHAIYLINLGATLQDVARNLRNNIKVTEEYYSGFAHTDATRNRLKSLFS